MIDRLHQSLYGRSTSYRGVINRWGPSYWRLPGSLRRRIVYEAHLPKLPNVRTWYFDEAEQVYLPEPSVVQYVNAGRFRAAGRPYRLPSPFVAELAEAWLVGRHATPVTSDGRVLMTSFRNQPRMASLEPQDDLVGFLDRDGWRGDSCGVVYDCLFSMVSRLDTNYFHWLAEYCTWVEAAEHYRRETGVEATFLIRADGPKFQRDSLLLLGVPPDRIVTWPAGAAPIRVRRLLVGSLPGGGGGGSSPRRLAWIRNRCRSRAGVDCSADTRKVKLYVPRRAGGWRCVVNDDDVAEALSSRGFELVRPESLDFTDQVRLFARASEIVGMHGSGLTNAMFSSGARVLELTGEYGDGVFYSLAVATGQGFAAFACDTVGHDVRVDTQALLDAYDRESTTLIARTASNE